VSRRKKYNEGEEVKESKVKYLEEFRKDNQNIKRDGIDIVLLIHGDNRQDVT